ncbi:transporter [Kosakonia sp. H02]|nr:transporter [Kosakonia sp. H02]
MPIIKPIYHFLLLAVAVSLGMVCLYIDVNVFHNGLSELSVTEIVQEAILFAIAMIWLTLARRQKEYRERNILTAGFFTAMLFRELDAFFDLIAHGSWVWFSLLAAASAIACAMKNRRHVPGQVMDYTAHTTYGMMSAGLICILVFSRLFGLHIFWQDVMQGEYIRIVKNIVEEETELFGYILCLTSSVLYLLENKARS